MNSSFFFQLSNVIRRDGDLGEVRYQTTNGQTSIILRIEELMKDFENELSRDVIHALENLKTHSRCLSDIPPQFSSGTNERLHREIRSWFNNRTTVGLETAMALLTINFTMLNRKKKGDKRPIMTESIGTLDQMFTSMECDLDPDEITVFDKTDDLVEIPNDLFEETYKLIGVMEHFTLSAEHQSVEILIQSPFHSIPDCKDCKDMEESDILKKFGLDYIVPPVKSPAFALSQIENRHAMIEDILTRDELSGDEKLQASCDALGNVIVLLSDYTPLPIQTLIPSTIRCGYPLIIYQSSEGFYLTSQQQVSSQFCKCGKNNKDMECCKDRKCPCIKTKKKCNERCRCHHCSNKSAEVSKTLLRRKTDTCRCGQGAKKKSDDGSCNESRYCICLKSNFGCNSTPKCRCKNCQNPMGERVYEKGERSRDSLPKHQGKLRIAGSDDKCYAQEGLSKKDSRWTDRETLALFVVKRFFRKNDEILNVFNYVHQNMPVLELREKTWPQILGKTSNIEKYMCIYHDHSK